MQRLAAIALALWAGLWGQVWAQEPVLREVLEFEDLHDWALDDHAFALDVFLKTCGDLDDPEWASLCALAKTGPDARLFFETFFRPVRVDDGQMSLVTGYYEPELRGSRTKVGQFTVPVYRKPPELREGTLWHDRRTIETTDLLQGRGLEIAWVDDPAALFYMQVQGSGRIRLSGGNVIRLGYAASNGHVFRSLGEELVRQGIYEPHQVSAAVVGNWIRRNPVDGAELIRGSPNYVFFREIPSLSRNDGPRGAMNRSITAGRTLAVDPRFIPLGAPVWMEKGGPDVIRRLMVAQDTGSAIKGAQRADYFVGTGAEAGQRAARIRNPARLYVLLPINIAFAMSGGASR